MNFICTQLLHGVCYFAYYKASTLTYRQTLMDTSCLECYDRRHRLKACRHQHFHLIWTFTIQLGNVYMSVGPNGTCWAYWIFPTQLRTMSVHCSAYLLHKGTHMCSSSENVHICTLIFLLKAHLAAGSG